jgi:predicted hotdog family 3-hydroxylacyl-ACP dehydratase
VRPAELLPHGPAAVLIDSVLERGEGRLRCAGSIPAAYALVRDGQAPSFVALELGAQAAALLEVLSAGAEEHAERRRGYLVSAREVVFERAQIPAGAALEVAVERAGVAGPLSLYRVRVSLGGESCARGTIGTFVEGPAAAEPAR